MVKENGSGAQEMFTMEEALQRVRTSPPLRKVKDFVDRTDLSADMKALLYDIAKFTIKVGEVVVAIGRRVLDIAMGLIKKFPNMTLGVIVAVALATLLSIAAWPLIGGFLSKLLVLLGLAQGAVMDIRQGALKQAMDEVEAEFSPFTAKV